MSSSTLIPHLDLGNTFGALFVGVILAAVLFGITNVQAFIYFQTHRGTGITLFKLLFLTRRKVIWLWILDALHLALITHCVYYYLVTNYANITVLTEIVWSFKLQIVIDPSDVFPVNRMYACRIWIVSKGRSRVLPAIVVSLLTKTAYSLFSIMLTLVGRYQCHLFSDLIGIEWATFMTLGTVAFIDFIIASSLCYILATSRTGFSRQATLMAYTINTGCLTSACSMITIITCAVMPTNFIFLGIEFLIAKRTSNTNFKDPAYR
ncbi:hypothetical protein K503DRAFT_704174 [Rhizopogon vinicolor AM-OR11-026]|uniref:DUF6534 domain-containing protein n=1 Tax=Rhizopogon vinicolor AM-OR11-026 TaxID=1314800 RepID=A0A1B7MEW1_9AGAM|nr:hypothetical protein K503DRAFT_704174 [Rhizopogon vinicolor AM-OR11-026]